MKFFIVFMLTVLLTLCSGLKCIRNMCYTGETPDQCDNVKQDCNNPANNKTWFCYKATGLNKYGTKTTTRLCLDLQEAKDLFNKHGVNITGPGCHTLSLEGVEGGTGVACLCKDKDFCNERNKSLPKSKSTNSTDACAMLSRAAWFITGCLTFLYMI